MLVPSSHNLRPPPHNGKQIGETIIPEHVLACGGKTPLRPELDNGKQIGEIVPEHVACGGDGVLPLGTALHAEFDGVRRFQDLGRGRQLG